MPSMADSTCISSQIGTVLEQTAEAVSSSQTEIIVFLLAFAFHYLLFGRLSVPRNPAKLMQGISMPSSRGAAGPKASARGSHAKDLSRSSARLCELSAQHDTALVTAELSEKMRVVPNRDAMDALVALLDTAGKSSTRELLASVREVLRARDLSPNVELGELLLRAYFGLRLTKEFDELICVLESTHGPVASISMLALKAAIRSADLKAALDLTGSLQSLIKKDPYSPSISASGWVLPQLVRLASQEQSVPQLLKRFQELNILSECVDTVLVESIQSANATDVSEVMNMVRSQGLQFGEAAYAALIKGATAPTESLRWFIKAINCMPQSKDILKAASAWALCNDDAALANMVLQKLPQYPPAEVAGDILRFHCKGRSKADADATVLEMYENNFKGVDLASDEATLHLVALAAVRHNDCGSVRGSIITSVLASIGEAGYISLLKLFGAEKQVGAVQLVLDAAPKRSACLYNAGIEACMECGNLEKAKTLMQVAVRSGLADATIYNTMVKAHLHANRARDARDVMKAMRDAGFKPNNSTFNEFCDAAMKTGNADNAWQVVEEMRASGVQPNRITCTILLKGVQARTKASDVERILAIVDEKEDDFDDVLLCSVVEACIRAGRAELLIPLLKKHRPSTKITSKCSHIYGSIMRAYGYVGDISSLWETWREMTTGYVLPNAVNLGCMVEALTTNGEVEAGYDLINEMLKDEQWRPLVNAVIYCSVLKGFSHQKRFDRMWTVYKEMLGHKLQFSIVTFNTLLDACSRNGEMSRIPALLNDMVSQGIQPNIITYGAVLKGYCQENRVDEAFAVVKGMMETTDLQPDEIMFNTLLDGCARQGLYSRGLGVLEDMEKSNVPPTNYTLSVLVKLASRSKKLENAFQLCNEMTAKYKFRMNVHVYTNLVSACIVNRDLKRAVNVFEMMLSERVRPDIRGYTLLLRAHVSDGLPGEASGLLRAAVGLPGVHPNLAKYDSRLLVPQGVFPTALITEVLERIAGQCHNERLSVELLRDLRKNTRVKLDPKLQFRIASTALKC